jgi:hypothetical protein
MDIRLWKESWWCGEVHPETMKEPRQTGRRGGSIRNVVRIATCPETRCSNVLELGRVGDDLDGSLECTV